MRKRPDNWRGGYVRAVGLNLAEAVPKKRRNRRCGTCCRACGDIGRGRGGPLIDPWRGGSSRASGLNLAEVVPEKRHDRRCGTGCLVCDSVSRGRGGLLVDRV
jgi:hypothetical protein